MKPFTLTTAEILEMCYAHKMRQYLRGSFLNRFGHNPEDVDDLVQDVIIKLLRQLEAGLEFETEKHFLTYFTNAVLNKYMDRNRANTAKRGDYSFTRTVNYSGLENVEQWLQELSEEPAALIEDEGETEAEKALRILRSLPDMYRIPLELYVDGETYQDIADILGLNLNTAKARIFHARRLANELRQK